MNLSEIQQTFHDSTVFITGSTGFLGNILLEKLLRSCSLKRIYLLIRQKKGVEAKERVKLMFDEPQFVHIKTLSNLEKVVLINGDILQPDLGINSEDKQTLINEVNFIIHCAACIRFDEVIDIATKANVRATRDLIQIAKEMEDLKAFVYVSTAYSNCNLKTIDEVFYDTAISSSKLIDLVEALEGENECLEAITKPLLRDWPNTYLFTKQITESVVQAEGENLPICVVRPSIVGAALREPLVGYVGNFSGLSGFLVAICLGYVRVLKGDINIDVDIVPVDLVVNNIIAAAWNTAVTAKRSKQNNVVKIYNCVNNAENPFRFDYMQDLLAKELEHIPSKKIIWYPWIIHTKSSCIYGILSFMFHVIPVYLADFVNVCRGNKPWVIAKYHNAMKLMKVLDHFLNNEWKFFNKNTRELRKKMSIQDNELFNFDILSVNWTTYIANDYLKGLRVYLLKDPLNSVEEGKRYLKKLIIYHYISIIVAILLAYGFLKLIFLLICKLILP